MLRLTKPICWLLIVAVACLSLPPARAAMVPTGAVVEDYSAVASDRRRVRAFLERAEVCAAFEVRGIAPEEALARVNSLGDREVARIAARLDRLPAGGDSVAVLTAIVILSVIGFVVLVFLGVVWIVKEVAE